MSKSKKPTGKSDAERRLRQSLRFGRILKVLGLIQGHGHWSSGEIARELECSERTVRRDLQVLELAGIPWYFDQSQHCYRVRPGWTSPATSFTAEEVIAQATRFVVSDSPGLHIGNRGDLRRSFMGQLSDDQRQLMSDTEQLVSVLNLKLADHSQHQKQLVEVRHALLQRRQLRGDYVSPYKSKSVQLTLHPYRLCLTGQAWYVIARPHGEDAPKTYRVARFNRLELLQQPAVVQASFNLGSYFGNAWGVYRGTPSCKVRLWFTPDASRLVTETRWQSTQEEHRHADGSLTLTFTVDGFEEIGWWILGWGGRVKVLEPSELRQRVTDQLRRGIELHRQAGA
jgi:predicted DNA-binding transcriptional regulator YafY